MPDEDDFNFYLQFVKSLILTLTCLEDRILASAWVKKLMDTNAGTERARTDHLKLLLFVINRGHLSGPFLENPNDIDRLKELHFETVTRDLVKTEEKLKKREDEVPSPCIVEVSADLKQYAVAQDTANFGVHVYYALSPEPMEFWNDPEDVLQSSNQSEIIPHSGVLEETGDQHIGDNIEQGATDTEDFHNLLGQSTNSPANPNPVGTLLPTTWASNIINPFDEIIKPPENQNLDEDIPPPTWGSNLINLPDEIVFYLNASLDGLISEVSIDDKLEKSLGKLDNNIALKDSQLNKLLDYEELEKRPSPNRPPKPQQTKWEKLLDEMGSSLVDQTSPDVSEYHTEETSSQLKSFGDDIIWKSAETYFKQHKDISGEIRRPMQTPDIFKIVKRDHRDEFFFDLESPPNLSMDDTWLSSEQQSFNFDDLMSEQPPFYLSPEKTPQTAIEVKAEEQYANLFDISPQRYRSRLMRTGASDSFDIGQAVSFLKDPSADSFEALEREIELLERRIPPANVSPLCSATRLQSKPQPKAQREPGDWIADQDVGSSEQFSQHEGYDRNHDQVKFQSPTNKTSIKLAQFTSPGIWGTQETARVNEESPPGVFYDTGLDMSLERETEQAQELLIDESPPGELYSSFTEPITSESSEVDASDLTYEILTSDPPLYYRRDFVEVRSGITATKPIYRRSRPPTVSPVKEMVEDYGNEDLISFKEELSERHVSGIRRVIRTGVSQRRVRRHSAKPQLPPWVEVSPEQLVENVDDYRIGIDSFEERERELGIRTNKTLVPSSSRNAQEVVDAANLQYEQLLITPEEPKGILEELSPEMEFNDDELYFEYFRPTVLRPTRSPRSPPTPPTIFEMAPQDTLLHESPPECMLYSPIQSGHPYQLHQDRDQFVNQLRQPSACRVYRYPVSYEEGTFQLGEETQRFSPSEVGKKLLQRRFRNSLAQVVEEWVGHSETLPTKFPTEKPSKESVPKRSIVPTRLKFDDLDEKKLETHENVNVEELENKHVNVSHTRVPESSSVVRQRSVSFTYDESHPVKDRFNETPETAVRLNADTQNSPLRPELKSFKNVFEEATVQLGIRKAKEASILRTSVEQDSEATRRGSSTGGEKPSNIEEGESMVETETSPTTTTKKPKPQHLTTAEAVFMTLDNQDDEFCRERKTDVSANDRSGSKNANIFEQAVTKELLKEESPPREMFHDVITHTQRSTQSDNLDKVRKHHRKRRSLKQGELVGTEEYAAEDEAARGYTPLSGGVVEQPFATDMVSSGSVAQYHSVPTPHTNATSSSVRWFETPVYVTAPQRYVEYIEEYSQGEMMEEGWIEVAVPEYIASTSHEVPLWNHYYRPASEVRQYLIDAGQLGELSYEIAEPFAGRFSPGLLDTSPMPLLTSFIEDDLSSFRWMR